MKTLRAERKVATGFTIVELLIVIVVVAILAAITIVSYNGIQQRTRNTQVISGVNAYYKAFLQYATIHSAYPLETGCLGADYPSDRCWVGESGTRNVNATLDAALVEVIDSKPTLATSLFSIGLGNNIRGGATYEAPQKKIVYYLQGANQQCGMSGSTGTNEGGIVTQCQILLPAL